jgi:hypothetical protein
VRGSGGWRWLARVGTLVGLGCVLSSGCTTALVLMHVQSKVNEGEPAPCVHLNSVERAFSPRCGNYVPGRLAAPDVARSGLPECPLTLAARDPQFWPMLPELSALGARPENCQTPPLVALAQAPVPRDGDACPPFTQASVASLAVLARLGEEDPRALHHDVMRILSCPEARSAGLDSVLNRWRAEGRLVPRELAFSPFSALHPSHLDSTLSRKLEATGHAPALAFQGRDEGQLAPGFEEALRTSDWPALAWWLARVPDLVRGVPPMRGRSVGWLPLARVLSPGFMPSAQQGPMIEFLMARGADPWQRLPHAPSQSVVQYARQLQSPWVSVLDPPYPVRAQAAQ